MSQGELILYAVLPYAAITTFLVGHWWRYRRDQYRWGARSTQLLESRWLMIGSNLFHFGARQVECAADCLFVFGAFFRAIRHNDQRIASDHFVEVMRAGKDGIQGLQESRVGEIEGDRHVFEIVVKKHVHIADLPEGDQNFPKITVAKLQFNRYILLGTELRFQRDAGEFG